MDSNVNITFTCKVGPETLPTDIEGFGKSQNYQNILRELTAWGAREITQGQLVHAGKTINLPKTVTAGAR